MKRIVLTLLVTLLLTSFSQAQHWKKAKLEVFGGISTYQYFGDIGGSATEMNLLGLLDIDLPAFRPGVSLGARYHISKPIQIKAAYATGFLAKSDLNSINQNREFAFSTSFHEVTVMGEYYIVPESDENYFYDIMQIRGGLKHFTKPFSLYVTLGVGGVYYKVTPKLKLNGHPRFSEGNNMAILLPVGIGIKYAISPKLSIGVELIARTTTSNTLDGYDSPFAKYNDFYHSLLIKANYKIYQKRRTGFRR